MKTGCHIPYTSLKWITHFTQDDGTWMDHILERMEEFTKLSDIEREANKERSENKPPTDLDSNTYFDDFSCNLIMQHIFLYVTH